MYKYESFEEYIQLNYLNFLVKGLSEYIKENELVLKFPTFTKVYDNFSINDINVFRVQFVKNKTDKVEFDVHIFAKYVTYDEEDKNDPNLPPYLAKKGHFKLRMYGSFKDGFKARYKDELEKLGEEKEVFEKLTSGLVPVISTEELDSYATKFLEEFCPEALKKPTKLDVNEILLNKGIHVFYAPLEDNVFGKTYFAKDKAMVFTEDEGAYYPIEMLPYEIEVEPGYILVNFDKHRDLPEGVYRNTIIHEAVHWFFHRNYFELRLLLNEENTCSTCYKGDLYYENDDIAWMEWQARSIAPRILMPKDMALLKYEEIYNEVKEQYGEWDPFAISISVLEKFADFFGASKSSAKIRLRELGINAFDGIENYVDGGYIEPFAFKEGFLEKNQSFIISSEQLSKLLRTDVSIQEALETEKLLYINKMLVANNPKYVDNKRYKLTKYAQEHIDECCLVFDVERFGVNRNGEVSQTYLFSAANQRIENKEVNEDSFQKIICMASKNASHYDSHKKELNSLSLGQTIEYHYKKSQKRGVVHSYEDFADKCDIDVKKIRSFRYDEETPDRMEIIRMGLTLKLSYPYIEDLIKKADCEMNANNGENAILKSVLLGYERNGLVPVYRALEKVEMEKILDVSDRWRRKYVKKLGDFFPNSDLE